MSLKLHYFFGQMVLRLCQCFSFVICYFDNVVTKSLINKVTKRQLKEG